jgi:2,3-bisphosphoglycerate-independent phosphoglycerate mutase
VALKMKGLLIIADGLGGRPSDTPEGRTCLEAARTPHLDELARRGAVGLLDPIAPGVRPGSDTAHLSLFGYDPFKEYPGRGVFEAVGVGLEVKEGDICFRTNFATVDERLVVKDRRAGRIAEGQAELEGALQQLKPKSAPEVEVFFKVSTEHRGALVLRGPDLSAAITEADPHATDKKVLQVRPTEESPEAERTARIVNEIVRQSYELLEGLPINREREREGKLKANILLLRGASTVPHLRSLPELYGIQGTVIAAGALYIGIGVLAGLEFKRAEGATGKPDSNLLSKIKLALQELKSGKDFVFVHMKGADSAGHDHNAQAKIAFIERIDEAIGYLIEHLDFDETHLAFTADHCTPIVFGDHTADPVPLVIAGPNVLPDKVNSFDERSAMEGGLGRLAGRVVPLLAGYNDWLAKFGT